MWMVDVRGDEREWGQPNRNNNNNRAVNNVYARRKYNFTIGTYRRRLNFKLTSYYW